MSQNPDKLVVIWISGDKEIAVNMAFMYALNSRLREWWQEVTLVIWGPSAKVLANEDELKPYIKKMLDAGVEITACKACTDNYGVSAQLKDLGIKVIYMGEPLTNYLKEGTRVLTV